MRKNYFLTLVFTLFTAFAFAQVSLPHYEAFDYTVAAGLGDQPNWEDYSGGTTNPIDVVAGNLMYSGFADPSGNSINMVGGSVDSRILFNEVTTGEVYVSFLMNVTDISNMTDFTDGGYFAIFASTTNAFQSRLWVKPTVDASSTTVDFAFGPASSGTGFGQTQNLNSVVLVVMSYNVDTGVTNAWINPSDTDFGAGSAPTPDFTETDTTPTTIDRLLLRQDSTGETANMLLDELRIGATWASVTPSGTVNTDPSIVINAPTNNQVFDGSTTQVPVTLTIENFTLSGDNGSGMSDGTGDGFIRTVLQETGQPDENADFFTDMPPAIDVVPGRTYTVTAELVDNSGNSLSPVASATVTFSVELPCDLMLGTISNTCDTSTAGTDTYTSTIAFTGGGTAVYTITALDGSMNPVGTVGGADPSTMASGNITISGIPEGTDVTFNITGDATSSCDETRTLFSPICVPFPVYEPFDYAAGTDLIASTLWQNTSTSTDEIQVVTGTLANPYSPGQFADPTGNMVNFGGSGSDSYIEFTAQSTGLVYASFIFTPTDISTITDTTDGGYFAILAEAGGAFRARLYLRQNAGDPTRYELGISESGSATNFDTTTTYLPGEETFVVMEYNLDTNEIRVWANPDPADFEAAMAPATQTLYHASGSTAASIGRFIIRQDSDAETPDTNFDELRISTTWADVTPKSATASVGENRIDGFAAYPNPVRGNRLTVTTNSTDTKKVDLFNVLGRRVFTQSFSGTSKEMTLSNLSSGIYILKVTEGNRIATQKVIIE